MNKGLRQLGMFIMVFAILFWTQFALAETIKIAIIDSGAKKYVDNSVSFTNFSASDDSLGHGTKIAKLIRSGSPTAEITMLQVCEKKNGVFKPSRRAIFEAVKWAVAENVDVVNMSLVTKYDPEIERVIEEAATRHGIVFVAASGNTSIQKLFTVGKDGIMRRSDRLQKPLFPASSSNVISVGAVNSKGKVAQYSVKTSDVIANGRIYKEKGTSFACARVTAKVANIISDTSFNRTPEDILALLK